MTKTTNLEELARALVAASPDLDDEERLIWVTTYRLLGRGEPISEAQVARASGVDLETVEDRLDSWPLVLRDDQDRIVGFWGLHVEHIEPTHTMTVDGATVFGWCAEDTLFIPEILGREADVESADPQDGSTIRLTVTGDGIVDLDPPGAVVSLLLPEDGFTDDAIARFCHQIHFFTSSASAESWIDGRPGRFSLPVEDAFELGRLVNRNRLGVIDRFASEG